MRTLVVYYPNADPPGWWPVAMLSADMADTPWRRLVAQPRWYAILLRLWYVPRLQVLRLHRAITDRKL